MTPGGRKLDIRRPRVRTADGTAEVGLTTYETATATDLLAEHMVGAMLAGLSTRRSPAAPNASMNLLHQRVRRRALTIRPRPEPGLLPSLDCSAASLPLWRPSRDNELP